VLVSPFFGSVTLRRFFGSVTFRRKEVYLKLLSCYTVVKTTRAKKESPVVPATGFPRPNSKRSSCASSEIDVVRCACAQYKHILENAFLDTYGKILFCGC
jgi:hypothetical protein